MKTPAEFAHATYSCDVPSDLRGIRDDVSSLLDAFDRTQPTDDQRRGCLEILQFLLEMRVARIGLNMALAAGNRTNLDEYRARIRELARKQKAYGRAKGLPLVAC